MPVQYKMFIDGEWVDASNGETFPTENPFTGEVWATIPRASEADSERAATAAALSGHKVNLIGNIIVTQVGSLKWAFAAVAADAFQAAVSTLVVFGLAGEWAARQARHPGTYGIALIDGLDALTPDDVRVGARVVVGQV